MQSSRALLKILPRFASALLLTATALFASAGTFYWWNAWVLLAFTALIAVLTGNLFQKSPDLLKERAQAAPQAEPWDRALVPLLSFILPLLALILAGLDKRWGWTHSVTAPESLLAAGVMGAGMLLTYGAMKSNVYFSSYVRIQSDRGHQVAQEGPYRIIRHPGYAGIILYNLAAPILLGSIPSLGAGMAVALLTLLRIVLEDRTLRKELKGYEEYAAKVRYRLIPLIW